MNLKNKFQKTFACVHPKKKSKRGYRHSGEIVIEQITVSREYSFLEYIQVSVVPLLLIHFCFVTVHVIR